MPELEPFDTAETDRLLSTTKAVRRRLDLERPVPRDVVVECIRLARYAPNASNGQDWKWVVVDDPDLRKAVGEQYRKVTVPNVSQMLDMKVAQGDERGARISRSVLYLAEHMHEVPVLVIPCFDLSGAERRYEELLGPLHHAAPEPQMTPAMYASIYPAVWSFQLALRSRGLGSVFTTLHLPHADRAAELLGIPAGVTQAALIPVAYFTGDDFKPAARRPMEEVTYWNGWKQTR